LVNCLTQAAKRCSKTQIRFGIQFSRINLACFRAHHGSCRSKITRNLREIKLSKLSNE